MLLLGEVALDLAGCLGDPDPLLTGAAGVECEVICEWHEDFLVISSDGNVEAVSVKHRDDGSPGHAR